MMTRCQKELQLAQVSACKLVKQHSLVKIRLHWPISASNHHPNQPLQRKKQQLKLYKKNMLVRHVLTKLMPPRRQNALLPKRLQLMPRQPWSRNGLGRHVLIKRLPPIKLSAQLPKQVQKSLPPHSWLLLPLQPSCEDYW